MTKKEIEKIKNDYNNTLAIMIIIIFILGIGLYVSNDSNYTNTNSKIHEVSEIKYNTNDIVKQPTNICPTISNIKQFNGLSVEIEVCSYKVYVNGQDNIIKILNDNIQTIHLNGIDNIIYYPKNSNPNIYNNGINNKFYRY